jgi:hypothetical protein
MPNPELLRLLLLVRMIVFLAFMYLVFGWIVERATAANPASKMRGFARLICSPLTRPVAALTGTAEEPYARLLRNTLWAVGGLWIAFFAISEYALAR